MRQIMHILAVVTMLFSGQLLAVDTTFMHTYGGLRYDDGYSCIVTMDGGVLMAGSTGSFGFGDADMYVVKTDSDGTYLWSNSYGGLQTDNCYSVIETSDTGLLLVGYTNSFGAGQYDVYVIKTNATGDTIWTKTFGGAGWDIGYDVLQSMDGGYVVVGETYSTLSGNDNVFIIKLDENGDVIWTKSYGGGKQDFGKAIIELPDSTLIIAGGTSSIGSGGLDVLLLKLNVQGDSLWARAHGGVEDDWARDVIVTIDNGLSAVGTTMSFNPDFKEMYQIKTDATGANLLWQWNWGQINNQEGYAMTQRSNGNFILFGYTMTSGGGGKDFMLQETEPGGWFISGKTYGGSSDESGHSFAATKDNGFVLFGTTDGYGVGLEDFFLIKTDSTGNDLNGNPIVLGTPVATYLDTAIPDAPVGVQNISVFNEIKIYPVPISGEAVIELPVTKFDGDQYSFQLFNPMGQALFSQEIEYNSLSVDCSGVASGIYSYLVTIQKDGVVKRYSGKLMILHD